MFKVKNHREALLKYASKEVKMVQILVVEDEESILLGLQENLEMEGYNVTPARTGDEAVELIKTTPNLNIALIDLMLPGKNGFEVCRHLRKTSPSCHIIMLTAKSDDSSKITGLEMGADDYVTKPFSILELLARIKAALRKMETSHSLEEESQKVSFNNITIDFKKYQATRDNSPLDLNPREYQILQFLIKQKGDVVLREDLLEEVWGYTTDNMPTTRTVDNHIVKLRQKLEVDPSKPKLIISVRGVGYRLDI